ncbi:MAG: tetratricopeptide repeat protein [Sandaracinus sp.]|nr:tetratricopeptide repeat protein [Sandaracinus sp.]
MRLPLLAFLLVACTRGGALPPPAVAHNLEGTTLLEGGDLDGAEARFRLALEYHPRFAEPRANLGLVLLARGDLEGAERELRAALSLDPDFDEAWSGLGVVLDARGQRVEAAEAWERALSIDPGLVAARRNLADTRIRLGQLVEARAQLMRLVQLERGDGLSRATALLAYCELRLGRKITARETAERVLAVEPDHAIARVVRGSLHAEAGRPRLAIADLLVAIDDPLVGFDARLRIATIQVSSGAHEEATPLVHALLREAPEAPGVRLVAAWHAAGLGRWDEAAAHARSALRDRNVEAARTVLALACEAGAHGCP